MKICISIACSTIKIDSFYKYAIAQLNSMRENSGIDVPIVFWYDALREDQRDTLKEIWNNIEFRKIDIDLYKKHDKFSGGWFCFEGWKLKEYDKVILMDCDFICQGPLEKLVKKNCDIGMVKESTGIYNGGLTVLGAKYLRSNWYQKFMELYPIAIRIGGDRDKFSKDQKLYNYFFEHDITSLPHKYNWLVSEHGAHKALLLHYIYKPLYDVGRRQLFAINENFVSLWEEHYKKGCERAGIQTKI